MKKFRKTALYTYRVILFLVLVCSVAFAIGWPLCHIIFFLLKKLAVIYLPYSAWGVLVLMFLGGVWAVASEAKSQKATKKFHAEWDARHQIDRSAELMEVVETCLAKYPYEIRKGDYDFTLFMPDRSRTIHFNINKASIIVHILLGGWDEDFYDVDDLDNLKDLEEELSSELDDWLSDRIVQVCFVTDEDKFPYSFACEATDMDEIISEKYSSHSSDPWWCRLLRFIFLFPPPKPVLEIQITSANGVHDRTIPCHQGESRVK